MSYASAEHDRMIAALVIPCYVVAVDLAASPLRLPRIDRRLDQRLGALAQRGSGQGPALARAEHR
jgi:hypothetical protein